MKNLIFPPFLFFLRHPPFHRRSDTRHLSHIMTFDAQFVCLAIECERTLLVPFSNLALLLSNSSSSEPDLDVHLAETEKIPVAEIQAQQHCGRSLAIIQTCYEKADLLMPTTTTSAIASEAAQGLALGCLRRAADVIDKIQDPNLQSILQFNHTLQEIAFHNYNNHDDSDNNNKLSDFHAHDTENAANSLEDLMMTKRNFQRSKSEAASKLLISLISASNNKALWTKKKKSLVLPPEIAADDDWILDRQFARTACTTLLKIFITIESSGSLLKSSSNTTTSSSSSSNSSNSSSSWCQQQHHDNSLRSIGSIICAQSSRWWFGSRSTVSQEENFQVCSSNS